MKIQRIDDEALWDSFVSSSPQGSVFSKTRWIKAAAAAQGGLPRFIGVIEDNKLAAGVTGIELSKGGFRKITTPVLTPYGGVIYRAWAGKRKSEEESYNMDCSGKLIEYIGSRYQYSFLIHSPGITDIRPFTWAGWQEKVRYTYVMDLTDIEKIWDQMERRVRTVLRKAESDLELHGAIEITDFGELYEHIYKDRGKRLPIEKKTVTAMVSDILNSGLGEMRTVLNKAGDVVSSMVVVSDETNAYAWISGSIPESNSSGAFSLLFWDVIRRYSENCTYLDMVGANIPSVAFFKKGFGAKLKPYYVTERYSSHFSKAVFRIFGQCKKLF
ncbi:MAG: GNAT family N-acetyltransferase [Candidatus Latescibacteria bacterium]|nr:GNAT family N-acetyltransferase [Candidatus Latescibacterota bacterium]